MLSRVRQVAPGLARAVGVAGGALAASAVVSVGAVPLALIAGALVPARWLGSGAKPGLAFASTAVLRAGVVCVGFKMNLGELAALGAVGLPCVAASVATGLFVIPRLAKRAGLEPRVGQLLAIGTSICGVTAISALAPAIRAREEEIGVAVSNVVVWGACGMLLYPHLAHLLFAGSPAQAGLFLGLAVHDTSQVMGAAASYAATYGEAVVLKAAAVAKLTRNVCLAAALPYLAVQREAGPRLSLAGVWAAVPNFVLLFVAAAGVRSGGDALLGEWQMWRGVTAAVGDELPRVLLCVAMAGVGLQISPRSVASAGWRPFAVGLAGALLVASAGLTAATLVGNAATLKT